MSPETFLLVVAIVLVVGVVGALTIAFWWLRGRQQVEPEPSPGPLAPSAKPVEAPSNGHVAPMGIDPNNPPKKRVYRGDVPTAHPPVCSCHQRPLQDGVEYIWWPLLDPPGVVVVMCPEHVDELKRGLV